MLCDIRHNFPLDRLWVVSCSEGVAVDFEEPGPRSLLVFSRQDSAANCLASLRGGSGDDHHVLERSFEWLGDFFGLLFHRDLLDGIRVDMATSYDFRDRPRNPPIAWIEETGVDLSENALWVGGALLVVQVAPNLEWTISVPVAPTDPSGLAAELLGSLATRTPATA